MMLIATADLLSRSTSSSRPFFWALMMRTEDIRDVRVVVTDDALLAIGSPCVSGIPQLEGEYRSRIEKIASAKHDFGFKERDGSVLITQADID
jgi:hypothetical protein